MNVKVQISEGLHVGWTLQETDLPLFSFFFNEEGIFASSAVWEHARQPGPQRGRSHKWLDVVFYFFRDAKDRQVSISLWTRRS